MPGAVSSWLTRAHHRVSTALSREITLLTKVVNQLQPYIESIFQLLHLISQDPSRSEGLMRASMGVLG